MILTGLVRLALVKSLRPAVCVLWLALLLWTLATSAPGENALLGADGSTRAQWEHGAVRSAAWSVSALFTCTWLALQAARTLPAWRRRDVDWLAPRGAPALPLVLSSWLGIMLAALVLAAATAAATELCVSRGASTWIEGPQAFEGGEGWLDHEHECALALSPRVGALPRGARLRMEFTFGGPGSKAVIEAWVTRSGSDATRESSNAERSGSDATRNGSDATREGSNAERSGSDATRRGSDATREGSNAELARTRQWISARGTLEIDLPALEGGELVHLRLPAPDARMYHDAGAAQLWIPSAHEELASLSLLAELGLALAAWTGLAFGLGGWLGTGTATFALLALLATALFSGAGESWLPLARLGSAFEVLEQGRVPRWPSIGECAGALGFAGVGLACAWSSVQRWRRER